MNTKKSDDNNDMNPKEELNLKVPEPVLAALPPKQYDPHQGLSEMLAFQHVRHWPQSREQTKPVQFPPFLADTYENIQKMHGQMQGILDSLDVKLDATIQKEERDFLSAYRSHLQLIQSELLGYRSKLTEQQYQLKRDATLFSMEKSLAFFKEEAIKLDRVGERQRDEIKRLKATIETLERDKHFLELQVKKAKTENKSLHDLLSRASSQDDPLPLAPPQRNMSAVGEPREKSAGPEIEARSEGAARSSVSSRQLNYNVKFDVLAKSLKVLNPSKEQLLAHCHRYYQLLELKHEEIVASLQQQLAHERKISQKLRSLHTDSITSKSELERLFCDCVEEVRNKFFQSRRAGLPKRHNISCFATQYDSNAMSAKDPVDLLKKQEKFAIMEHFMSNEKLLSALYATVFRSAAGGKMRPNSSADRVLESIPDQSNRAATATGRGLRDRRRVSLAGNRRSAVSSSFCVKDGKLLMVPKLWNAKVAE